MAERNLFKKYMKANSSKRVDIIIDHYSDFLEIVDGYTDGLRYMIESEKESNRRKEMGDLGVRIQSGSLGDPTGNQAIRNVMTREALINCDFSGDVMNGVDRVDEFVEHAYLLRDMRNDYELFTRQLSILGSWKQPYEQYIRGEKNLVDISEEYEITYDSAKTKMHRIRLRMRKQVLSFMNGEIGGIM